MSVESPNKPIGTVSANSVELDLGCTSIIYFDNVTLTLHNVTLRSQKPCQHSKCAAKQTVINEVHVVVFFQNSDILLKKS